MPTKEYHKQKSKEHYQKHKTKYLEYTKERTLEHKKKLIALLGGKCSKCGYDKCIWALEFHHRDRTLKKLKIRENLRSKLSTLTKEIENCDLLCANCHREVEFELFSRG